MVSNSSGTSSFSGDTTRCFDGLLCMHQSKCKQNPSAEGHYYCDCGTMYQGDLYDGLSCEYKASQYCSSKDLVPSFCTNGGTCTTISDSTGTHFGCKCLPGYVGSRCQFVGNIPSNWPQGGSIDYSTSTPTTTTKNTGAIVLLVVIILLMIGLIGGVFCYFCRKSRNTSSGASPNLEDLTMEVGDDVVASSLPPPAEGAESSFPHPDEIKNNRDGVTPNSNTRAEVKLTNSQEEEEDGTNELI
mmetsp:Transcript_18723/g.26541  ORF Transcript_18723/g.26541 Transcript_18723/m.26541 type:complete len:243 (-) Transcript_18723:733-1461(-)